MLTKDPDMRLGLHHRDEGNSKGSDDNHAAAEQDAKDDFRQIDEKSCRGTKDWGADGWADEENEGDAVEDNLDSIYERTLGGMGESLRIK